jgi:hypothetical protein
MTPYFVTTCTISKRIKLNFHCSGTSNFICKIIIYPENGSSIFLPNVVITYRITRCQIPQCNIPNYNRTLYDSLLEQINFWTNLCVYYMKLLMEISQIRHPLCTVLLEHNLGYGNLFSEIFFRKHNTFLSRKHEIQFRSQLKEVLSLLI